MSEQWLRDAASRRPARAKAEVLVATGLAAGQLIAAARETPARPALGLDGRMGPAGPQEPPPLDRRAGARKP